jgi:hypothetical protein
MKNLSGIAGIRKPLVAPELSTIRHGHAACDNRSRLSDIGRLSISEGIDASTSSSIEAASPALYSL